MPRRNRNTRRRAYLTPSAPAERPPSTATLAAQLVARGLASRAILGEEAHYASRAGDQRTEDGSDEGGDR